MTTTTTFVAGIGTIWASGRQVQIQWEVGQTWVALVLAQPGQGWSELATVARLDTKDPELTIAEKHRDWCTDPVMHWQLAKQAQQSWQLAWHRQQRDRPNPWTRAARSF